MAYPVFDLHCDTADRIGWATLDLDLRFTAGTDGYFPGDETHPQDFDLIEGNACAISLAKIGNTPWAQCFATFVPDEIPTAHAARFQAQIMAHMSGQAMLNHDRMVNVRSAADIRPALKDGKVACIHTIENATFFAEDPALIEVLKSLGVLMSSLSWNAQGPLASGHDTHAGLTAAGIEALTQMEHAGMVLDVSHLNDECFDEVVAHATRPFVASHSNSRTVCGVKRNLTDDQFRTIRDMGGIVGLNYCSKFLSNDATDKTAADVTFDQLAAHIEHWLDLGGENDIALDLDTAACQGKTDRRPRLIELNAHTKQRGVTAQQHLGHTLGCRLDEFKRMLAQIAINIVAHRAIVNRGVQTIVLPRRAQVGIEHQRNDELLTQRVLLGIHAMVGKNLKAVNDNTVGMAKVVIAHMGYRRRSRNFTPTTTGELSTLNLGGILRQFFITHRDRLLRLEPRSRIPATRESIGSFYRRSSCKHCARGMQSRRVTLCRLHRAGAQAVGCSRAAFDGPEWPS